jgi:hypothetical protein
VGTLSPGKNSAASGIWCARSSRLSGTAAPDAQSPTEAGYGTPASAIDDLTDGGTDSRSGVGGVASETLARPGRAPSGTPGPSARSPAFGAGAGAAPLAAGPADDLADGPPPRGGSRPLTFTVPPSRAAGSGFDLVGPGRPASTSAPIPVRASAHRRHDPLTWASRAPNVQPEPPAPPATRRASAPPPRPTQRTSQRSRFAATTSSRPPTPPGAAARPARSTLIAIASTRRLDEQAKRYQPSRDRSAISARMISPNRGCRCKNATLDRPRPQVTVQ